MDRSLRRVALLAGAVTLVMPAVSEAGDVIYAIAGPKLVRFNVETPGRIDKSIALTGLPGGVTLGSLDERPLTGGLYAVGTDSVVYAVTKETGRVRAVGAAMIPTVSGAIGIDFNPTVDRIRIVTSEEQNRRANPNNGTVAGTDTNLAPGGEIVAVAYENNVSNATSTTLDGIDSASDQLIRIGSKNSTVSPNGGITSNIGPLGFDTTTAADLDIAASGTAYASLPPAGGGSPVLARVDVNTGGVTTIGTIGDPAVTDIAVASLPVAAFATVGTGSNISLLRFAVDAPLDGQIVGPLVAAGAPGETITKLDFRPATGDLLGISTLGKVYRINPDTAAATLVGSPGATGPATGDVGFDVDPTTDEVRVVTTADANVRLNPFANSPTTTNDTAVVFAGADSNFGDDPTVIASAYGPDPATPSATGLFDIDRDQDALVRQTPQNSGLLNTIAQLTSPLGGALDVSANAGYDIAPADPSTYLVTRLAGAGNAKLFRFVIPSSSGPALTPGFVSDIGAGSGSPDVAGIAVAPPGLVSAPATQTSAEADGVAHVVLTRTAGEGGANVDYAVSAGSASSADVDTAPGTATFEDGQDSATIDIPLTNDTLREDAETFTVTLEHPSAGFRLSSARTTTVTVLSDDAAPAAPAAPAPIHDQVTAPDTTRPAALLSIVVPRLKTVRARGLAFKLLVGEAATATEVATVDAATRKRLKLKSGTLTGAVKTVFTTGQAKSVTLRLTKDAKAKLAKARSVTLTVRATVVDLAGNKTTVTQRLTLR
jgi:hypothetical protein